MSKLPTAEKFFFDYSVDDEYDNLSPNCKQEIVYKAIVLIKLHVQAALKAASENAVAGQDFVDMVGEFGDIPFYEPYVVKESILNAYPLTNIK